MGVLLLVWAVSGCPGGSKTSSSDTATSGGSTATGTATGTATMGGSTGSGGGTASGSSGGALPPPCMASSECGAGGHCLNKPCDVVMNEPGCGEFRCYADCSDPITDSASWECIDEQGCCGGYPCMGGMCTEVASGP